MFEFIQDALKKNSLFKVGSKDVEENYREKNLSHYDD